MTEFTTEIIKIPASAYLKVEARDFAFKWGWALLLPVVASAVGGIWDVRFLLIALILVFVVIPPVIALVYFTRLLSPEAPAAMRLRGYRCRRGQFIEIRYYRPGKEEDEPEPDGNETIDWENIVSVSESGTYFAVRIKNKELPLLIPAGERTPRDFFQPDVETSQ